MGRSTHTYTPIHPPHTHTQWFNCIITPLSSLNLNSKPHETTLQFHLQKEIF